MKGKAGNERQLPFMTLWKPEFETWPGYYELNWMTSDEKFYTGLFVVQILNLIAAFFLLFASVSLMYGIHVVSVCIVEI
ncbi:unnamed protein product [Soboliphyme baturini]|uniref:Transmembrane 9 superfamily member n=1 Tax=Soboliphyme baturini TaxID=241478 RepID=A0A183IVY8_9BILA|nr:unnamed protein product [Soboliphyme baturini]